jgi:hypothetical protein
VTPNSQIDWEKLLRFNSGSEKPEKLQKVEVDPETGQMTLAEDVATEEDVANTMPDDED